jgi:hypothetical protein
VQARTVVGATVFEHLRKVGVITAVLGPEPNNLATAQAKGRPLSSVPLEIVIHWANGDVETRLSSSVGDYDAFLVSEENRHQTQLAQRAKLNTNLPIHRP